jgi:hypothetical protein
MNSRTSASRGAESGNILVVTLLILFAITTIGMTVASVSSMDLKITSNQRATTRALFIAEAGLNEAIHRLTIADPTTVTVGGWTGNAAISDTEPYDPNWTVLLYLDSPASVPSGSGSVHTTGTLQDLSGDFLDYSAADGSSGVLTIRHKWIDRNGDGTRDQNEIVRYDPLMMPPENFVSGNPVEVVSVTGRSGNGAKLIQAEVTKKVVVARTLGALYVDKAVRLTGNSSFCGHNHSIDTPVGTRTDVVGKGKLAAPECFAYHLEFGHLPGVTATGDEVKTQGSADVQGDPAPIDNSPSNPFYSLAETFGMSDGEMNNILAGADNTKIQSPLNGITVIEGDAKINSNLTGEGLLYVTGDLQAAGNFVFKGVIYVEGDVFITGSPWILGTVIVRGTSDFNFSAGNAAILYSSEAMTRALSNSMPAILLSWQGI